MAGPRQLLLYKFRAEATFDGRLIGVLERMEAGGAVRTLDVLVVGSDPETGGPFAVDLRAGGAGGMVAALVGFRLDAAQRRAATRRLLSAGGARAELALELAETLEPGEVCVALLIRHDWAGALSRAVQDMCGRELASATVEPETLAELAPELLAAAGQANAGG